MTVPGFEEFIEEFLLDANERVRKVQDLLLNAGSTDGAEQEAILNDLKRELHTLKGNAGMMGFTDIQSLAHGMEENLKETGGGGGGGATSTSGPCSRHSTKSRER